MITSALMIVTLLLAKPASPSHAAAADCQDPLPINPEVVTKQLKLEGFRGAAQFGPVCRLTWKGGSGPTLMIYGPSAMADMGTKFTSTRQAADRYRGESPQGVQSVPGLTNGYMVFDPKTPNRRIFVEYQKKVYMIVSNDRIPVAVIVQSLIQRQ